MLLFIHYVTSEPLQDGYWIKQNTTYTQGELFCTQLYLFPW